MGDYISHHMYIQYCEVMFLPDLRVSFFDPTDFCTIPKDEGTGKDTDIQIVLYYNATRDKCYPFRYTGVGGNGNRFGNERECMRNCSANTEGEIGRAHV